MIYKQQFYKSSMKIWSAYHTENKHFSTIIWRIKKETDTVDTFNYLLNYERSTFLEVDDVSEYSIERAWNIIAATTFM